MAFDESDFLLRFANRQAEAVPIHGPRQNVPQFRDILWAIVQAGVLLKELADGMLNECVRGIATPGQAQQDIGIKQIPGSHFNRGPGKSSRERRSLPAWAELCRRTG